jgi:hypothetical protein
MDSTASSSRFSVAAILYPADAEDLLAAAPKLGAEREEMARILERCGFPAPPA